MSRNYNTIRTNGGGLTAAHFSTEGLF